MRAIVSHSDRRSATASPGLFLRATLLAGASLLALAWLVPPRPPGGDGPVYLVMVEDLASGSGVQAHRLLGPWLVAQSGLPPDLGFRLLTYLSLFLMALCLSGAGASLGLRARASLLVIPIVLTSWAGIGNLWDYQIVDALTWALVAAAWWALAASRLWLVALFAAVGTLAKEVALLASLAAALVAWRWRAPLRSAATAIGLLLPPAAALLAVTSWAGLEAGGAAAYWQTWLATIQALGAGYLLDMTFSAYSLYWLLALRGLLAASPGLRVRSLSWLVVGAPLLLAGTPERMAEFLAPAVATLAALAASRYHPIVMAALVAGNGLSIAHKASGFLSGESAYVILVSTLALAVMAELSSLISSRALGSGLAWLRLFQPTLGSACLALFGGLFLSLGAPHGGFRAIEPPAQAVVLSRIDLEIIALGQGLANGQPAVIGLIENHGRATAWLPSIGNNGRVLLSAIEPGQSAPFVARSAGNPQPAASADPPAGARPSTDLRAIQVTWSTDESRGGTVVAGRILNLSSTPLSGVRVVVVAHDDAGSMTGLAETSAEVEQDRLAPGIAEPFRVHFPTGVAVSSVAVFGEGTVVQ